MQEVTAYFDESGNSGPIGTGAEWAALGAWLDAQDASAYPCLLYLWEHGWYDDLPELESELESIEPGDEDAKVAALELLELIEGRAEDDSALALTITND